MNISFNPEMAKEMIQKMGFREKMDSAKAKLPFDLSLVSSAFKNNVLVAFLKKDETAPVDSIKRPMNGFEVLLALPIASQARFEELKTAVNRSLDSLQKGDTYSKMLKGLKPIVKYNNELCVLSLSPEAAAAFLENPGSNPEPEWLQPYKQYPLLMSIHIRDLFTLLMSKKSKGKPGMKEKAILDMFDQLIVSGGNYENECMNTTMELKFADPNQNALKQLFDTLNSIVTEEKESGNKQ